MKKHILTIVLLTVSAAAMAQTLEALKPKKQGWFNHLDAAFTVGTGGLGFDFATPMSEWAQLRIGGEFRPLYRYDASFNMEVGEGMQTANHAELFQKYSDMMQVITGRQMSENIDVQGDLRMNHFKLLVDIFPFKKFRKLHFTVGFYYGNDVIVDVHNTKESTRDLEAINIYNSMYHKALGKESLVDLGSLGITDDGAATSDYANFLLRNWGARLKGQTEKGPNEGDVPSDANAALGIDPDNNRYFAEYAISMGLGNAAHDIIADQDIYYDHSEVLDNPYYVERDGELVVVTYRTDDNGREIKKGGLRYKKGEVMRHTGDRVRYVPDASNTVNVDARVNKFKPYLGMGFTTPLTKDKRTNLSVDAGVLFWGGRPSIIVNAPMGVDAEGNTVYTAIDLVKDVTDMPGKVQSYVNSVKKFVVFPEISLRISQRLW